MKVDWPAKSRLLKYIELANSLLKRKPVETALDEEESEAEDFANRRHDVCIWYPPK